MTNNKIALVTGTSRIKGIGCAICKELAKKGFDIFLTYWRPYDNQMPWGIDSDELPYLVKWLIGVVANALNDTGCQNHLCLVLTGEQGKFKTTWLDNLCPASLKSYLFTGKIDPQNKDVLNLKERKNAAERITAKIKKYVETFINRL